MARWQSRLAVGRCSAQLLMSTSELGDVLKARLPLPAHHPRALLTLLEGAALWSGSELRPVISADDCAPVWLGAALFGDELWPAESQLVRFEVGGRARQRPLAGLGDFRALRRVQPRDAG
jgi:hypothetical protein